MTPFYEQIFNISFLYRLVSLKQFAFFLFKFMRDDSNPLSGIKQFVILLLNCSRTSKLIPFHTFLLHDGLLLLSKFMTEVSIPISAIKSLVNLLINLFQIIKSKSLSQLLFHDDLLLLFKLMTQSLSQHCLSKIRI